MPFQTLLGLLAASAAGVHAQATLETFTNKAAFITATSATSATGPLPNLGLVGNHSIGSLSFAANIETESLYIGAVGTLADPDWYPPIPGNEIALTKEELAISSATPVFSLGFDFIEPKTTVQTWSGVPYDSPSPVNSIYRVTLYRDGLIVGEFMFDAPDDVLAFVGVHSSQAFTSVTISDTSGDPDDEYFGQFYTGTVPSVPRTFTAVARSGGATPGASGTFAAFPLSPAARAGHIGFFGLGSSGQQGVYSCDSASPVDPCRRIADLTTAIPGETGLFTGFGGVALARAEKTSPPPIRIAFLGAGAGQQGVYVSEVSSPQPPPIKVADLATSIPGGSGAFTGFSHVAARGSAVAFRGTGAAQQGVYNCDSAAPVDPCRRIADLTTAVPGGTGAFTGFTALAVDTAVPPNPVRVAFIGTGSSQQGVYSCDSTQPVDPCRRIADLSTPVPQGTGTFTSFNAVAAGSGHVALLGRGSSGQAASIWRVRSRR